MSKRVLNGFCSTSLFVRLILPPNFPVVPPPAVVCIVVLARLPACFEVVVAEVFVPFTGLD